jgi:hypothetical protein
MTFKRCACAHSSSILTWRATASAPTSSPWRSLGADLATSQLVGGAIEPGLMLLWEKPSQFS